MSISPFSARPASPENESRRARLVLVIATLGIAATLLAYAISPGVRHAVSHAAHSVKNTVSRVLDHDTAKPRPVRPAVPRPAAHPPLRSRVHRKPGGSKPSGGSRPTSSGPQAASPAG